MYTLFSMYDKIVLKF